jgi:hypothetical protein
LARAFDWQSKGQEFDSPNLHSLPGFQSGFFIIMPGLKRVRNVLNQVLKKIIDAIIDTNESEGIERNLKDQTDRICLYLYRESFSF